MQLALEIYTNLDSKRDIAISFGNLGSVYRSMGNYGEALKYIEKAISLRLEMSDIKGAGRSYTSKGYLYSDKNNRHWPWRRLRKRSNVAKNRRRTTENETTSTFLQPMKN
jgi:tetratricopeptide (TPR) repeat protein